MTATPRIGIICDHRASKDYPYQMAGDEYADAVQGGAGALPLLIPSLPKPLDPIAVLESVDGILFTGSPSNVAPRHYGGPARAMALDEDRDALSLAIIPAAIARAVPVFCICRGFQELNVALGGTLHQMIHAVPGFSDHRPDKSLSTDAQYAPVHRIVLEKGGLLDTLRSAMPDEVLIVNSLHGQGIDRLAPDLIVEARAEDGVIEAVRHRSAAGFLLGVQWHPEWRWPERPFSAALFAAFGDAARKRANAVNKS